jgi:hypothetical protein
VRGVSGSQSVGRYIQHVFRVGEYFPTSGFPKIYRDFQTHKYSGFYYGVGRKNGREMALNVKKYGIDNNKIYKKPYKDMVKLLKPHTRTVKLMFKSALDVDYSKLEYDMVLTCRRITT